VLGFVFDPWLTTDAIHRVIGDPVRIERPLLAEQPLKVITWNIERGSAYDAILKVLEGLEADVLLLQEVDRDCRRTGYRNVARDLAFALNMNWVAAGEFQEIGEARRGTPAITGQAVLSRFAIHDVAVLRFKAQDRWRWSINPLQPRRGGRIALKASTGGVLLYNTHIESGGDERLQQQQMAEILADQARIGANTPVVVAGDFNNGPLLQSRSLSSLTHAAFVDALGDPIRRRPTSLGQSHPIDWIFVKHVAPARGHVVDAPSASDHFPVLAAFLVEPSRSVSR
jgi:endonuclease/exonuclease/phosphatase family metal-dependent hydrolase